MGKKGYLNAQAKKAGLQNEPEEALAGLSIYLLKHKALVRAVAFDRTRLC